MRKTKSTPKNTILPETLSGNIVAAILPCSLRSSTALNMAPVRALLSSQQFSTVVLISQNSEAPFERISVFAGDEYPAEGHRFQVSASIREELCDEEDNIFSDILGHPNASIQNQLAFMSGMDTPFEVVPIVLGNDRNDLSDELGQALGEVMYGRRLLILALADVTKLDKNSVGVFIGSLETMQLTQLLHMLRSGDLALHGTSAMASAIIAAHRGGANRAKVFQSASGKLEAAILYQD